MPTEEFIEKKEVLEFEKSQFPDINMPGNLVFCGYMTEERLAKKFILGIRKRGGDIKTASYYPDKISLSAISTEGYKDTPGIRMGWSTLYYSALRNGYYDNSYQIALVIDPLWITDNISDLLGVGGIFENDRKKHILAGPIKNIPIAKTLEEHAFFEEVHCNISPIPPSAISGIVLHDDAILDFPLSIKMITDVIEKAKKISNLRDNIAIYDTKGKIIRIIKNTTREK